MTRATWLGSERRFFESCESTNDEASKLAAEGAAHGTVVVASTQTAGRGRQGRTWFSPPGRNLYVSCILRPSLPPANVSLITLAAGVAVCDAVNFYGAGASLEWPNDVVVGRKKIAGILTEMQSQGQTIDHVVLGIGVNVRAGAFPPTLVDIATSVSIETETDPEVGDVLEHVLAELEPRLDAVLRQDLDSIRAEWRERAGLPRRVSVDGLRGRAISLSETGALVVVDDEGEQHEVISGDVTYERGDA